MPVPPPLTRQMLLTSRPKGVPEPGHFTLSSRDLTPPAAGEILIRNRFLSVDPAQRGWANDEGNYSDPVPLGTAMRALAVGEVIESRAAGFAAGDILYGWFGWQDYCVATPAAVLRRVVETDLPLTASLGVLGINGLTAYMALHRPAPGGRDRGGFNGGRKCRQFRRAIGPDRRLPRRRHYRVGGKSGCRHQPLRL